MTDGDIVADGGICDRPADGRGCRPYHSTILQVAIAADADLSFVTYDVQTASFLPIQAQ